MQKHNLDCVVCEQRVHGSVGYDYHRHHAIKRIVVCKTCLGTCVKCKKKIGENGNKYFCGSCLDAAKSAAAETEVPPDLHVGTDVQERYRQASAQRSLVSHLPYPTRVHQRDDD